MIGAMVGALLSAAVTLSLAWPARWLQAWVLEASAQHLQLADTQGPWWSGQTRLLLRGGAGATDTSALPGTVSWRINPTWQGGPGLSLRLWADCCIAQSAELTVTWNSGWFWSLEGAQGQFDLRALSGLGTPWNTLNLSGAADWSLHNTRGSWQPNGNPIEGHWTVQFDRVSSDISSVSPLGSYTVEWHWQTQGKAEWILTTRSGDLKLEGEGQFVGGRMKFRGEASSSPESATALSNLLNIIGRRRGDITLLSIG